MLADHETVGLLRREIDCVFVDEYQDTDPSQVRLLAAIAGNGRDVVVVGDPDQSIFGFLRGAEKKGEPRSPTCFRPGASRHQCSPSASPRPLGPNLLAASRNVADRLGLSRQLEPDVRMPSATPPLRPACLARTVEIYTCGSAGAEAEHIADMLRSAHLGDGLTWTQMAVSVPQCWQVRPFPLSAGLSSRLEFRSRSPR